MESRIMQQSNQQDKDKFIFPHSRYYGQVKPEKLVFNTNLQEFAEKVGIITSLETNGKLSANEAYKQIKLLWKQLKCSKKQLLNSNDPPASSGN